MDISTPLLVILLYMDILAIEGLKAKSFCYGPSGLPCTQPFLSCNDGYVLSVLSGLYGRKATARNCQDGTDICTAAVSCCEYESITEKVSEIPVDVMRSIQKKCSFKQSCSFNLPYVTNPLLHMSYFTYDCIEAASVLSLMCKDSLTTASSSYMFYSGEQRTDSLSVNCSCELQAQENVTLYTRYIHLSHQSCLSFESTLSRFKLPECNATYPYEKGFQFVTHLPAPVRLSVENLTANEDDIFWVRFNSQNFKPLTVSCTGCGVNIAGACGRTVHTLETCYGAEACSEHEMSCKEGKFLAPTDSTYFGGRSFTSPVCQKSTCNSDQNCCVYKTGDNLEIFTDSDFQHLYNTCLYQQSCKSVPQYRSPGTYTYVYYRYECIPESSTVDILSQTNIQGYTEVFLNYNSSRRHKDKVIDCTCDITTPAETVSMVIYRKKFHPDSCCQFNIISNDVTLPTACRSSGLNQFYTTSQIIDAPVQIKMQKLLVRGDDVVFMRISSGKGVNVDCSGCTEEEIDVDSLVVCDYPEPELSTERSGASAAGNTDDVTIIATSVVGGVSLIAVAMVIIWACKRSKRNQVQAFN